MVCYCARVLDSPTLLCSGCNEHIHLECEHINQMDVKEYIKFYCTPCENSKGILSVNNQERIRKMKIQYYGVRNILYHKGIYPNTKFLVHWENYPIHEATWEPIEHVLGCTETLSQYLISNNLDKNELLGAPSLSQLKPKDHCLVLMRLLNKYTNKFLNPLNQNLTVRTYTSSPTRDELLIVPLKDKIYIILYIKKYNRGYICDKNNDYGYNRCTRKKINATINIRIKCIKFNQHHPNEFDTAIIALTLYENYLSKMIPLDIKPKTWMYDRLKTLN